MSSPLVNERAAGVVMVLAAGACLSTAGVLLRHLEQADGWQILFWRNIAFVVTVGAFVFLRHRRNSLRALRATGRPGLLVALALGLGSICYVFAMLNTTVANVLFMLGAAPFVTALAAWALLGERVTRGALLAMIVALLGITLMFADGLLNGRWLGMVFALGVMLAFVVMLLAIRSARGVDMVPAVIGAGVLGALAGLVMSDSLAISLHDFVICMALGSAQFGAGFILMTLGARRLPAAETALLSLSETVLGPLWVWLVVNETPGPFSLGGGVVVMLAVVTQSLRAMRSGAQGDDRPA